MLKHLINKTDLKSIFNLIICFTIIWHLWSLQYSPLPWFDETFFASITNALINGKGFQLEICPIQSEGQEILTYGPVYFILTAIPIKIAGIGIFQFRIVTLLFSIFSIITFSKILNRFCLKKNEHKWLVILLVFDVMIIQNSHSGRMDMVALFFVLIAWWAYTDPNRSTRHLIIMGFAGATALLTTPRVAVIIFPLFLNAIIHFIKTKQWLQTVIVTLLPTIIYLIWIWYAFGTISVFFEYYFSKNKNIENSSSNLTYYLIGNFYVPFYQWPIIVTALFSGFITFTKRKEIKTLILISAPIIIFYLLVKDTGAYSALIIPFWYLLIALGVVNIRHHKKQRTLLLGGLIIIAFVNIGIFSIKAITILGSLDQRNPKSISLWIKEHIPKNSKIVGDDRYYYACMQNNCDFQYIERVKSNQERANYHVTIFKPDYLLISNQTPAQTIEAYREKFLFIEEFHYHPPKTNNIIQCYINKLPIKIFTNYEGTLIKISTKPLYHNSKKQLNI